MRPCTHYLLAATFLFLLDLAASAQPTWTGGGADNDWSTSQNWSPFGAPANDGTADVTMAGNTRLSPNINVPWTINSLTFNSSANAFTIGGNVLTIGAGGITNQSPTYQTLNMPVALAADQTWNSSGSNVSLSGPLNTNGHALTFTGSAGFGLNGGVYGLGSLTVALSGSANLASYNANSYSGGTYLNSGRLFITQDSSLGAPNGPVIFNGGELGAGLAFTINRDITLGPAGGTIDTGGNTLTISSTMHGAGSLTVLNATLKLTGTNSYSGGTFVNGSYLVGTTNSLLGNITLGGSTGSQVEFAQSFNGTYTGNINGPGGAVNIRGTGIVSLTGNNTYTAATQLYSGVLEVSAASGGLSPSSQLVFVGSTTAGSVGPVVQYVGGGSFTRPASQVAWPGSGGFAARDGNLTVNLGGSGSQVTPGLTSELVFGSPTANSVTDFQNPIFLGTSPPVTAAVEVNAGAGGDYAMLSGVISGAGSVSKVGNGRLVLTAANIYTGPTDVEGGLLSVGALANGGVTSSIGQSTNAATNLTFYNGGVLQYTGPTVSTDRSFTLNTAAGSGGGFEITQAGTALTVSGAGVGSGQLIKAGPGTLILTGANTFTGGTTINAGTLQIGGADSRLPTTGNVTFAAGTLDLNGFNQTVNALGSVGGAGIITSGSTGNVTLTVGNGGSSGSFSGVIQNGSGTVALIKVGAGTQTLTGVNTYTGGSNVNGGTLTLGSAGAIGSIGTISFGGGALQFTAANTTDCSPRFSTTNNQTYRLDTNGQVVTLGTVLTSASGSLTKLGAGTLTLPGLNTYTGPTQISGGILSVGVLANGGTTSGIGESSNAAANLAFTNGGILQYTGPTVAMDRAFTLSNSGGFDVNQATTQLTLSGVGSGTGPFIKNGAGALVLTGANTYSGGSTINVGILQIGAGGATGALGSGNVTDNGSLVFNLASNNTVAAVISGTGSVSQSGAGVLSLTNPNTYAGGTTINVGILQVVPGALGSGAVVDNGTLAFNVSGSATQSNPISGVGGISTLGAGALTLTGMNTYSGSTVVNAGTLIAGSSSAIGTNSAVSLANGTTLVLNGNNIAVGSLAGSGATLTNNANAFVTLTIGSDNSSQSFVGQIADGTGYPLMIVKVGSGTQMLSGRIANTGGYAVTGGTLELSGALVQPGPSSLTASAGTTIQYASSTFVSGGFLRGPGTHLVTGGSTFSGTTAMADAVINQTSAGSYVNFTNGGSLSIAAGTTSGVLFNGFTNQGSGSVTIGPGSSVSASAFETYGTITISNSTGSTNTFLINTGTTPLYFNGGSRTFIGVAGGNGQAQLELNGQNAIVAGGLFVNNGHVTDSSAAGISTVIADYGALVKGAGVYDNSVVTQNGGKFQSGNSPGVATMGRFVFGPGGVSNYVIAIDDATGQAGPTPDALGRVSGWGLVKAAQWQRASGPTSGDFVWTADTSHPLTVAIDTLVNPTTVGTDVPGLMADFDPSRSYSWPAVQWSGTYSGPTDVASLDAATNFDTSGFANPITGTFGWSLSVAQALSLSYTPSTVPEPGTLALTAFAGLGWRLRRRRP